MVSTEKKIKGERFSFNADTIKLLALLVNTFYKNKEVFLREVISNASDAINKVKFQSLTDPKILGDETDLKIEIIANSEAKTLTIRDNGIGMTKDDLIKNLGTLAASGTKSFMDAIQAGADIQMIGQFGVGFYSVFLVSDKVVVRSKHNDDTQHTWESTAGGEFDVFDDSKNEYQLKRGTELILYLKDDLLEFLEERRLKEIVKAHSEFVGPKILLWTSKEVEKEVDEEEEEAKPAEATAEDGEEKPSEGAEKEAAEEAKEMKIEEVTDGEPKPLSKKRKVKEIQEEWEQINKTRPVWALKPEDVTQEEYNAFYKSISNDWEDPLAQKHFQVEGQMNFTSLLFIPKRMPFDLFNNQKKTKNIKLYVRRVNVNEESSELCPEYLSFMKGVVDSEEMPLNISRESLQQNKITKVIRRNIVKKSIELFEELAENKDQELYKNFYKNFSKNLKLGVHEDSANRTKLASLLRFESTKSGSREAMRSFRDYIADMPSHQKEIYFITGENTEAVKKLPFLELLLKKNFEVLFMTEPIDEYVMQQLSEFDSHKLVSVTKEGLELPLSDDEKAQLEQQRTEFAPLCKRVKEILGNRVERVEVSSRMTESPCYISTGRYGWSSRMEQIMKSQALRDTSFSAHMAAKKILELNAGHPIVGEMSRRFADDTNDPVSKDLVFLLFETALLTSGGLSLERPMEYATRIFKLIKLGLNIVEEEAAEEVPQLEEATGGAEGAAAEEVAMEEVD